MAMDGSFSLELSLQWFFARCPKVGRGPRFELLAKKGHLVTEEEVVSSVAELLLHPKYTIPLIGCFRPIAQKIVDKAVTLLLLVQNLRSNSDNNITESGYFDDDEVINLIEFHIQHEKGLDLHELACLAFCRAIDLAPFLLGSVLNYFKFAPPPFERILMKGSVFELSGKVITYYLHVVRTSYRLLVMETEFFSKYWDWSCFLDLVKKVVILDQGSDVKFEKDIADIRWCAIQILSVILKMNDRATSKFGVGAEEAHSCLLRWEEFCQDIAVEKAGAYIRTFEHISSDSEKGELCFSQDNCLQSFGRCSFTSSQFHETEPPLRSRKLVEWDDKSAGNPFVMTSSLKRSFERVLLAVSQKWPVLLYGPAGAGKSALIRKMARDCGNQVLSIHMDDQIDGKTLIGSYVCTEQPGEFRWQPGSLTQAVVNGFWVVFEDIDKAPSDVLSMILPLLEGSSLFVTGFGEEIRVAESFRLFSTISTFKSDISHGIGANLNGVLWRKVMIEPPSSQDLQKIVRAWYPSLEPLVEKLLETFEGVNSISVHQVVGFQPGNSVSLSSPSKFSSRDLLKWCKRIAGLHFVSTLDVLTSFECFCIYQEAVDVFACFSTSVGNRLTIMKDIAKKWGVSISQAETLYPNDEPIIQDLLSELRIGRVTLQRAEATLYDEKRPFVKIHSSLHVLERIACSVKYNEPVLLVGETGTGKTTLVQNLAMRLGQKLTVLNLSQQSDVADLLGGFKPMDAQSICIPLYNEFKFLFSKAFSMKDNHGLFARLQELLCSKNWEKLLRKLKNGVNLFRKLVEEERSGSARKRKKPLDVEKKVKAWEELSARLETARRQIASTGMVFSFVEGVFVTALRNGQWILLDEMNLAPPEILQRVIGVLEGENGSLCLAERGDVSNINRHPNFRVFACMNPATDAGKRDLPYALRSRFTEYFVDDILDDHDLDIFIQKFLGDSGSNSELVEKIRRFYKIAKKDSEERLQDGANQKPQYSLRSLYRALEFTRKAERKFGFQNAIYDGFCMFFVSLLDRPSAKKMKQRILQNLIEKKPLHVPFHHYLLVKEDSSSDEFLKNYVLTKSVKKHLRNLSRAVFIKRYPVLLQGPTSSGKTSLVQYLATITGHEFVRINNHEHTDLQEYLGSYIVNAHGKLVFQEGVLVKAVRNGYWIVLDELNLAPTDVLEALNRLLDDNRELFVPELCETIRAHPDFMLFATQNPPTFYGGRKMLSRAFRNRFVEIHVDEIPEDELSTILKQRCQIPESYAKKMVEVMKELQLHRQSSKVFAGKHGFITPRDLFRWADRFRISGISYEDLARDGYHLLAERLRVEDEKHVVQEVLERHLRVKLVKDDLYKPELLGEDPVPESLGNVILTKSMRRLYFLVRRCYKFREPVLLVGETGGGKTTVCQLLSIALGLNLHILNCHQYTETSDFLGGFYPIRDRSRLSSEYKCVIERLKLLTAHIDFPQDLDIFSDICHASSTLDQLDVVINKYRQGLLSTPDFTLQDIDTIEEVRQELVLLHNEWQKIFTWQDGPLVQSMKAGDLFLVDEISLADDSVLERLNSVLEPERKLSLAEKGGDVLEKVTAHENFLVLATMNPGGDYGKKELSPALRNRFTEIWVPSVGDLNELRNIALYRLSRLELSYIVNPMVNFYEWFNQLQIGRFLTVRDLLSWIAFVNVSKLDPEHSFLHGAFLVLLDGLSLGTGLSKKDCGDLRERCLSFLLELLQVDSTNLLYSKLSKMENYGWGDLETPVEINTDSTLCDNVFSIDPFYIEKGSEKSEAGGFEFLAPTTRKNALRVLRAMQLSKPVLLEGSPGVGKTSLIIALGKFSGHRVVRINLSEQTDMMDLLGSDLPVESDEGMKFAWSDGILLQALKEGCWVLLDELNLAPQSVLEGLNAILDHRAEVFIPELGCTFRCPSSFRVFACQNPSCQGGGRKGLPKSFLNRFTKVYIDELVEEDYLFICSSLYPSIPRPVLSNLISFNRRLHEDTMLYHKFAQNGSPWEFNLRDVLRSCQILQGTPGKVGGFLNLIYVQRMRTAADRRQVLQLYEQIFGVKPSINPYPRVQLNSDYLIVGNVAIKRNFKRLSRNSNQLKVLPSVRCNLEAAAHCVQQGWLCILIGPPSSGKTSLIRLLAQLTGNVLHELNLSSATDISELLGCFEQYNAFRNFRSVVAQVGRFVNEYSSLLLEISMETFLSDRKDLTARWLAFLSDLESDIMPSFSFVNPETWNSIYKSLPSLIEIIKQLKSDLEKNVLPISWTSEYLDRAMKTILKLQHHQRIPYFAKFEWITGLLINAIENGEWIILENANLCNPTVLDRINSLVEPDGTITVNECGIVDGKPVVLHPHSNFRMFLTVNPSFGEVSRAMRNRGVEIFMMNPYWIFDEGSGYNSEELEMEDVKRFLVLAGIPGSKLVDSMAKAHAYAMVEGVRLNVRITYLELARWVQLFQHLLMNGNQPLWSLQISWDHTYLSSFGEVEGVNIVNYAKNAYFSVTELYRSDLSLGRALCLPGGWPIPLTLRDIVWYSKEVYVRQNCSYLEFLGAQYASHELAISCGICPVEDVLRRRGCKGTYLLDWKMLYGTTYPQVSRGITSDSDGKTEFNSNIANKMMLFAANWAIEQATENDFQLYLQWFTWFGFQLEPYCDFFKYFLTSLEQEWRHPIWTSIIKCRQELMSLNQIDIDLHPIPMLSLELVDLTSSNHLSNASSKPLHDAISCVGLLRRSYQQWNVESRHNYTAESSCFIPFLETLRVLEEEILNMLVGSPSYDLLYQLYTNLLEDHMLFWEGLISWQFERLLISWRSLLKVAGKLKEFCPIAVKNMLETKNLAEVSSLCFHPERSLLWVHGGHPFLPPSSKLYHQQHQLLKFCELVWPTKRKLFKQAVNELLVETMVSFDPELRFLALEGICMSSFIMGNCDEDEIHVSHQMEEVYQMLLKRFDYEKCKLLIKNGPDDAIFEEISATCCVLSSEMLHMRSGFDSWLDILPIVDCASCFLDMELLQELSSLTLVGNGELQLGLGCLSSLLESDLKYSLTYSTRPPQSFVPHQKLLWLHDAWTSVDAVHAKVSGFVLEMWFWWHSLLWSQCPAFVKNFSIIDGYSVPLPNVLIQPVRTASIAKILQSTHGIKDFSMHCLKLKAASCVLWQISSPRINSHSFLLSAARSLFQQIIYSHKKSFDAEKFAAIKSILCSYPSGVTEESLGLVSLLIASSSHRSLKSLIQLFIEPLLRRLYFNCSSTESYLNLGFAWLYIGGLRFNLLLSCDNLDPASKYSCKLSCLEEKIISHKLEMKVRQECNYLAGWSSSKETDKRISQALEKLEIKCRKLRRKIVFRPDPAKFKALRKECDEFCVLVNSLMSLVNNIEVMELQQIVDKVCNWQETASCFIDRLLNEYSEYIDIAQPIQVAVYEMKLGLALALLSALQKKFLDRIQEDNMDRVMELIYSFMRFPRGCTSELVSISDRRRLLIFSSLDIPCITNFSEMELSLLENMVTISGDVIAEKVSILQLKASLYKNCLVRVAHSVATAKLMDSASFKLLDKIFSGFASIWMHMKIQGKNQEDRDCQPYKFRPRAFRIENVMEVDISALGKLLANDNFIDWQELLSEEESTKMMEDGEKHENIEDEWNLMEESILIFMINMHNQLFGSADLVLSPGSFQITDVDRLQSFIGSYTLGVGMMKGFGGLFSSTLDAKLVQEHLLRLCWEYEQKFPSPHKAAFKYNFYKDSNTHIMAKMVELLSTLKHRVHTLLSEWEDHPGLQKVLDVIEMLLAIPLSTPLAKALSGLQFLLNRTRILEENGSKFSLSVQLKPLISLVCSWQKMEFCSWPVLLDEVQDQYDINAAKLWFPLFSVLHPRHSSDIAGHDQSTIQSLEEFMQTSSIGEFRKRLQLLFAFLGQIITGRSLEIYLSPWQEENIKILYNIFGFYVQFLPIVMELIEANRKKIETELKELLKLCCWDRFDSQLSIDNLRKPRQKIQKLIQKYSDMLQQPFMLILNEEVRQKGFKIVSLESPKPLIDISESCRMLNDFLNLTQSNDEYRSAWYTEWGQKVNDTLNLHLQRISELHFVKSEEISGAIRQCPISQFACLSYPNEWKRVWYMLKSIGIMAKGCGDRWMDVNRSLGKKRALSDLLQLLESSGLHRHKFEILEISNPSSWLFLQPSYDAQHLLMKQTRLPNGVADVASAVEKCLPKETLDSEWKTANEFYFKSLAAVQLLQQIRLKHHPDFTSEQVTRSVSYLSHLIIIQQMQRAAVYDFARQLKTLHEYATALDSSYSGCTDFENTNGGCVFAKSQHAIFNCMWQQKQLFDDLDAMLVEETLLLRTVEGTHSNSCQKVKAAANRILGFIEGFIAVFKKSKELLDSYFIGCDGSIITLAGTIRLYVISKQMEKVVLQNFKVLQEFEDQLIKQSFEKSSVVESVLSHFDERFSKGKLIAEQLRLALEMGNESKYLHELADSCCEKCPKLEAQFGDAFKGTIRHVIDVLQKLSSLDNHGSQPEAPSGSITAWESLFKSTIANLGVDTLCEKLLETIHFAENLFNHSSMKVSGQSFHIGALLKHIHASVDLILSFSDSFLEDFLVMHKTVSIVTHGLANILAALFAKGFGDSPKDQEDDTSHDMTQDASGTGMGEGAGVNDVSDQINDADQLLGASEKPSEEQAAPNDVPSKNEKGIEMEQDFAADTFSVSEDSGEDNDEDTEDQQLESAMGETGGNSEVIDEKLWDKDDDDDPNNNEKYESGPSVRDSDKNSREFRAKEDSAGTAEEPEENKMDELDKETGEIENQADLDEHENIEDLNFNKEEEFADPTGLKLDELNERYSEDINMDEKEEVDIKEEDGEDEEEESANDGNTEGNLNPADETMEEIESERNNGTSEKDERVDATFEKDDLGRDEEDPKINQMAGRKNVPESEISNISGDHVPSEGAATQPNSEALELRNVAPEANWANSSDNYNDLAQRNFPSGNNSDLNIMVADSSTSGKFTDDHPKTEFPSQDADPFQKKQSNPYRNVGDALQEWKERVSISVDLQDDKKSQGEMEDENANEYGYVSEFEKGTAQALGPATAEQIDADVNVNKPDKNPLVESGDDVTNMEIDEQISEDDPIKHCSSIIKNKMEEQIQVSKFDESANHRSPRVHGPSDGDPGNFSEFLVSVKKSYLSDDVYQINKLSISEEEMGKALDPEEVSGDVKNNATALWRKYELLTTRLSQELAEQLRLVMEPTLASKLQGDYKTGKRLNMKKVIPYIASHYRKDKIWLRRTRPNKRDYQVIIAVDDSYSMSESGCGEVAIKALVTVCRAMSQLEVGNLAVASFGKKGNIRLLHDFDQPFTGEAGVKMISSLTFKQDNTIRDEPVVDLLMFLNKKLDAAVANARLPSGQNPLQQLVLIIGDGRLYEKEKLKRCVRDVLSSKRMVAFLILDSLQESIMDLQEVITTQDKNNQFKILVSKYLDSFPFPYYVVLRNIEALPKTLADLLRQWFELMQNSRD
ncbi:PREDICTED: midasin [Theobroma cacao]|uniref:Midasin n=1 Tax=Theobroma cacao TaxID=3641 RepID=A0AB32WGU6_THECC|nr:PREDICTED: midasin [Theobroma cacao]